eukprot:scaffold19663_cov46-Prasinocladus_malaysianus.AAC.3
MTSHCVRLQEAQLRHHNLTVKQKSLLAVRDLLGVSEWYIQALDAGVVSALVPLMKDADALVRQRSAAAMELVATKDVGVAFMADDGAFNALVACLEDEAADVRVAAYKALIEAARFEGGRTALSEQQTTLPRLVELIQKEDDDICALGLTLLKACAGWRA